MIWLIYEKYIHTAAIIIAVIIMMALYPIHGCFWDIYNR